MKILLCAATPFEARACLKGIAHANPQNQFEVLQTGMGQRNAELALRDYLSEETSARPDWIISTGFAGSRSKELLLGNWILGSEISAASEALPLPFEIWNNWLTCAGVSFQSSQVYTVDKVVSEINPRALPVDTKIVDMESFALAKVAKEFGVPFQILRLISDTPEQPIPQAIVEFSSVETSGLLLSVARGLLASAREPKKLVQFAVQSVHLPGEITRVWEKISQTVLILFLMLLGTSRVHAFSVDDYLVEVQHSHDGYRSLQADAQGSKAAAAGSNLFFKPQVFTELQYSYDPRDTHAPSLEGNHTIGQSYQAGLREQTPWGLQLQLGLDYEQSTLLGVSSPLVTRPTTVNFYPVPVLNWSIWQNFGGRLDKANQRMQEAQALAQSYGSDFNAKALLVEAEGRYWRLASIREVIRLQNDSLDRARSVMKLDTKKAKQRLIDSGDTLLSEAAVQGKELELKSMLTEERSAARAFNSSRGMDSEEVKEALSMPSDDSFTHFTLPERKGVRGDLKVAEEQQIASQAGYDAAHEKLLPNVNLFGSIFAMGLNFSMPLDLSLTSDSRNGYAQQSEAAELSFRRKQFEQESDWKELKARFADNLERLQLAIKLEALQKRKFEDARKRRERAMTVAFQVFQFELDYLAAAQTRLQIEGNLLGLRAQAKLYSDDGKSSEMSLQ